LAGGEIFPGESCFVLSGRRHLKPAPCLAHPAIGIKDTGDARCGLSGSTAAMQVGQDFDA